MDDVELDESKEETNEKDLNLRRRPSMETC